MENSATARWLAIGVGGGDVPPLSAARAAAARAGVGADDVLGVDNLCRRAVEGGAGLPACLFSSDPLTVVARRPRAVKSLLAFAGVALHDRAVAWIEAEAVPGDAAALDDPLPDAPDWVPWYPVVEAERCVRCGQCVKFCLFGVYETAPDGLPVVARPEKCKNQCPACARICPGTAIVFPRYGESPFNGDPVVDDAARLDVQRADIQRILGDDPLAALRERQARARARRLVDPAKLQAALEERERHVRAGAPGEGP